MDDCHAHLSNDAGATTLLSLYPSLNTTTHLMSTNTDFLSVHSAASTDPHIIPYYGIHPWFSHCFYLEPPVSKHDFYTSILTPPPSPDAIVSLPDPILLTDHLELIDKVARERVASHLPFGIGEVGLDRAFTIPNTRSHVAVEHQLRILSALVARAIRYQCPIQLHGVKAHRLLFDALAGCTVPLVLHLFSGLADVAAEWIKRHPAIFFSLLAAVNLRSPAKVAALLAVIPPHCLVVETDRILSTMTNDSQQQALWQMAEFIRDTTFSNTEEVLEMLHKNAGRLLQECSVRREMPMGT